MVSAYDLLRGFSQSGTLQWQLSINKKKKMSLLLSEIWASSVIFSGKHSEIWRITSSMEAYKDEISDWDLGAGTYLDFYDLRSSMKEEVIMSDTV